MPRKKGLSFGRPARKDFHRLEADVALYNRVAVDIAKAFGVRVNDLFAGIMQAGRDDYLGQDGVHFTDEGYALLGKAVAECVRGVVKGMMG